MKKLSMKNSYEETIYEETICEELSIYL